MASWSLTSIVAEIVAIPGPLVTLKPAEGARQSLPRCKRGGLIVYQSAWLRSLVWQNPNQRYTCGQHLDFLAERE